MITRGKFIKRDQPRLTWLAGKQYPQHGSSRKNRPGLKREHGAALADNLVRKIQDELRAKEATLAGDPTDPAKLA
jgi:hypothetical protein